MKNNTVVQLVKPPAEPKDLAFTANELYVHIAKHVPDSQFKENMLAHVSRERTALIMEYVEMNGGVIE